MRTFLNHFQLQWHPGRMIVMISGIAFDCPDSLSHLRAFPDHFKIYTILPIVRIELNSIQAIDRGRLSHPGHL